MAEKVKAKEKVKEQTEHDAPLVEKARPLTIVLGALGRNAEEITIKPGTSLGEIKATHGLKDATVRVNKKTEEDTYIMQDKDLVIAVPQHVVGG